MRELTLCFSRTNLIGLTSDLFDQYRSHTHGLADIRPDLIVYPETVTGSYIFEDSLFLSFVQEMGAATVRGLQSVSNA